MDTARIEVGLTYVVQRKSEFRVRVDGKAELVAGWWHCTAVDSGEPVMLPSSAFLRPDAAQPSHPPPAT